MDLQEDASLIQAAKAKADNQTIDTISGLIVAYQMAIQRRTFHAAKLFEVSLREFVQTGKLPRA